MNNNNEKFPFLILIGGPTGAGKTTFAHELNKRVYQGYGLVLSMDNYYKDLSHLPEKERAFSNFDHPDAIDIDELIRAVKLLLAGDKVPSFQYNFTNQKRTQTGEFLRVSSVLILEGIFSLCYEKLVTMARVKIYLDCPSDIRLIRRVNRDMGERGFALNFILDQYKNTVRPMHRQFIEPSRHKADFIIDTENSLEKAISQIKPSLEEI